MGEIESANQPKSGVRNLELTRPDGRKIEAYLASPTKAALGNVVVIQEWWGLNDQICGVADRFARAGYRALAPDLYKGKIATDAEEAAHSMNALDFGDATGQDLRASVEHLRGLGGKTAVVGFCMGGALSILAALNVPGVDAATAFYGIPPAEFADASKLKVPFLGHFAKQDDWITSDEIDALDAQVKASGVRYAIHRYDAHHAFFNERRAEVYDANASNLAWERTLAFLKASFV